jgi:hypothetical protein
MFPPLGFFFLGYQNDLQYDYPWQLSFWQDILAAIE